MKAKKYNLRLHFFVYMTENNCIKRGKKKLLPTHSRNGHYHQKYCVSSSQARVCGSGSWQGSISSVILILAVNVADWIVLKSCVYRALHVRSLLTFICYDGTVGPALEIHFVRWVSFWRTNSIHVRNLPMRASYTRAKVNTKSLHLWWHGYTIYMRVVSVGVCVSVRGLAGSRCHSRGGSLYGPESSTPDWWEKNRCSTGMAAAAKHTQQTHIPHRRPTHQP